MVWNTHTLSRTRIYFMPCSAVLTGLYPFDISGIFLEFSMCGALQYSYCTCTVPYLDNGTGEITGDKLRWRDVYSSSLGGRGFLNVRTLLDAGIKAGAAAYLPRDDSGYASDTKWDGRLCRMVLT